MGQQARIEVLLDGVWCSGVVWDWETDGDDWWAVVSARPPVGKTFIGKVPETHVRVVSPPTPTVPQARQASVPEASYRRRAGA